MKSDQATKADLQLFPLSKRIQDHLSKMALGSRRLAHVSEPRIGLKVIIESKIRELSAFDFTNEPITRLKVFGEGRDIERPDAIDDALTEQTAQFFLRNTHRFERYADERILEYDLIDTELARLDSLEIPAKLEPTLTLGELGNASLHRIWAERDTLMLHTDWATLYGRPDLEREPTVDGNAE